jgi:hypothetical protein
MNNSAFFPGSTRQFLEGQDFFEELLLKPALTRYAFFLVDHGRESTSTHKFWWNHFEDACLLMNVPCRRVKKDFSDFDNSVAKGRQRVFLFFTKSSLFYRFSQRSVDAREIKKDDIIGAFDAEVAAIFPDNKFFQIGFASEQWIRPPGIEERQVVLWEAFAPVHFIPTLFLSAKTSPIYQFSFFGTINKTNIDEFCSILKPLYHRYQCTFRGLSWWQYKLPYLLPLLYGFSPFLVDDERGLQTLLGARINIVLHQTHHRKMKTLTERLFISALAGRPVICDNVGARRYFSEDEIVVVGQSAPNTPQEAAAFLEKCDEVIGCVDAFQKIALAVQKKTLENYTYLNTVTKFIVQLDAKNR